MSDKIKMSLGCQIKAMSKYSKWEKVSHRSIISFKLTMLKVTFLLVTIKGRNFNIENVDIVREAGNKITRPGMGVIKHHVRLFN